MPIAEPACDRIVSYRCAASSQARMPFCTCIRLAGLLDDDALRAVDHLVGHFLAAMGRQAVHEERALLARAAISLRVDLVGGEVACAACSVSLSWPMLAQTSV